jgi:F-box-like
MLQIDGLPTESLVKIFSFLSSQELLRAAKTCKTFHRIVSDFMPIRYPSIRIDFQYLNYNKVQKFTYKDNRGERDFNCLLETTQLYQNYIFINFNKEHTDRLGNKWLQLFKKQINARCIRIKSDCIDLQQLSNLIKLTHRLVFIEIDGYRIAKMDEPFNETASHIPSLKHLKIHSFLDTNPHIFKIFHDCRNLKSISLSSLFFINKKIKSINDFILHQRALEQLELIGLDSHNALFTVETMNDVKFKLKKINCEFNGYSFNLEKFSEFFCRQKSFKEVKLSFDLRNSSLHAQDEKHCDAIFRHIMTCDHLSSLDLLVNKCSLQEAETFSYNNNFITKLAFENESRGSNDLLVALLRCLPNLSHLELACEYSDDVLAQLPQLINLRHLKITDYFQGLLKNIKCADTLESISLQYCYTKHSGGDWLEFLRNHPNIKKIHIHHSIDFIDDATVDIISAADPKLEHFEMTDSTAKLLTEDAYRIFAKNCKNMRFLKLTEKPCPTSQNKNQSFHDLLANVKCVMSFYIICIIGFVWLVILMWTGKI